MEYLHENHYFTCSCGLKPAKMSSTQQVFVFDKKNKYYYLTKQSTASSHIGDFACRWTVVLAGLVAGLGIVTGGAALLVLGAAVLASGLMCGALFAPAREWIIPKDTVKRSDGIEYLTARAIMICPVGGEIMVAPGIDCWWKATIYTARNVGYAFLEGWFMGKMIGGGGKALFGAKNVATLGQFATNFAFLQGSARLTAAADQVVFEGMLRNGLSFEDAVKGHAVAGLTAFEQPFINIVDKVNGNSTYPDGTPKPLNWIDFYGAGMSAFGTVSMFKASMAHPNIPKATWNQIKDTANKIKGILKGKAYEETTTVYRTQGGELPNASQERIIIDADGNVTISGDNMLYVTLDDKGHQIYFYDKRGGSEKGAYVVSFEIPESLGNEIRNNAVPQNQGKSNPNSPQISDPTKSSGAYGLPSEYINKIEQQAIPGSGKVDSNPVPGLPPGSNSTYSPVMVPSENNE